jgi:SNF2 family DNA or RNA helicase
MQILDGKVRGNLSLYLKENTEKGCKLYISSPFFTLFAFNELKEVINKAEKVNFIFNKSAFTKDLDNQVNLQPLQLNKKLREKGLTEYEYELNLKNQLNQQSIAHICLEYIESKKLNINSVLNNNFDLIDVIYVENPSGKKFMINGNNVALTMQGLGFYDHIHFDFKMVNDDQSTVTELEVRLKQSLFDSKVITNVNDRFAEQLMTISQHNTPEFLYFFTLYHLFKDRLEKGGLPGEDDQTGFKNTKIWNHLFNFQRDGVIGAINKITRYNGCIIADSVGLGKTFEALAIIKYYELKNDRVLVLVPKKLRNNWLMFRNNTKTNPFISDRFNYDVLNHTDLSREKGMSGDIDLKQINWGNYDLVVIDESHNFRNNESPIGKKTRYQKLMEDIIKAGVKTKVLMLSATPVNTRLADLKNQIMFISENEDDFLEEKLKIESVTETLRFAQTKFKEWSRLEESSRTIDRLIESLDFNFFSLLNALTISRSRKHIKTYYDTSEIGEFPKRLKPISIKPDVDTNNEFPSLEVVNNDILRLNLAIYSPLKYVLPTKKQEYEDKYSQTVKGGKSLFLQSDREMNLIHLMRINLLKRMESSIYSFQLSVSRILSSVQAMLDKIKKGQAIAETIDEDEDMDEELEAYSIGNAKVTVNFQDLDLIRLKEDLNDDLAVLTKLQNLSKRVDETRDEKLKHLKDLIEAKMTHPINPNNTKIIVFTAFADTAEYLYEHLSPWFTDKFQRYTALITGSSKQSTTAPSVPHQFEELLAHFSPNSNHLEEKTGEIDLLVSTDCISEGQNLQDCDYLINYDIHWNPVRIIQRFGRIDRIGSKNKVIQLVNFWPNMALEAYIDLEGRVRSRMTAVAMTASGDDDLINSNKMDLQYRKKQLLQLQEEVLDLEDISGTISLSDLNLDEYLINLERHLEHHLPEIESRPSGIFAMTKIPEDQQSLYKSGVIFCVKHTSNDLDSKGNTSLLPFHLVYVDMEGSIFVPDANPKKSLDLYKRACLGEKEIFQDLIQSFNQKTNFGKNNQVYIKLLEKVFEHLKGSIEEKGLQSIFTLNKTSVKSSPINTHKEFELISYLILQ